MTRILSRCLMLLLLTTPLTAVTASGQLRKTRNVVLVTMDGMRWRELFTGIDPLLMNEKAFGMQTDSGLRASLWRPSAEERRKLLMPFLWSEIAPKGVVLGNVQKRSAVEVTNAYRVSYPGYAELFTGSAQDSEIHGNDQVRIPVPTVLEIVRRKLNLSQRQVAVLASWDNFRLSAEHTPGSVFINAGYQELTGIPLSDRFRDLSRMQFLCLAPWEENIRLDYITFEMAMEYLRREQPRLLYIALDEVDEWSHTKQYNRVLQTISNFDGYLKELWEELQRLPAYRGATTMVITTDHGRGLEPGNWNDHGDAIPGSEQIWIIAIGPDTPAMGEAMDVPTVFQRDIAPTILALLGIDPEALTGARGHPIRQLLTEE